MIEIERKFLVKGSFEHLSTRSFPILQGYLCREVGRTVRVRICGDQSFITIKGASVDQGLSRFEWEKEIPLDEANNLMQLCIPPIISKTRYEIPYGDFKIEVDVFHTVNKGLVMAEVEFLYTNQPFKVPDWFGIEVTGNPDYYNASMR